MRTLGRDMVYDDKASEKSEKRKETPVQEEMYIPSQDRWRSVDSGTGRIGPDIRRVQNHRLQEAASHQH